MQTLLANATLGLPDVGPSGYPSEPYKGKLTLEGVAQPTVAVGVDRFGAAVGGGVGFQFGDMLGDQSLTTILQVNSGIGGNFSLKNTAAQALYFNQAHRVNWGIVAGQIPYLSGGFQSSFETIDGEPVQIDQAIIFRQTEQSAAGLVAYPFNRAQRLEFQGGLTRISFDQLVETNAFSLRTGQLIGRGTEETSLADPLTLGTASAALVFDTSNFGADQPGAGAAIPARGGAIVRVVAIHQRPRRLPALLHARAVLHDCRPRDALRPLRERRQRLAPVPDVPRLPEPGARLRRRDRSRPRTACRQRPASARRSTS